MNLFIGNKYLKRNFFDSEHFKGIEKHRILKVNLLIIKRMIRSTSRIRPLAFVLETLLKKTLYFKRKMSKLFPNSLF